MSMAPSMVVPTLEDYYSAQTGNLGFLPWQTQDCPNGAAGYMSGSIPIDYSSMVEFAVCLFCNGGAVEDDNTDYDIRAGQHGQPITHVQSTGVVVVTYVLNEMFFLDLTAFIPAFDAGDIFGVTIDPTDGAVDIQIIGTKIKYRPRYPVQ